MLTGAPLDNLPRRQGRDPPKPVLLVSFVSLRPNLCQQLKKSLFRNRGAAVFANGRVVAVNRVAPPLDHNKKTPIKANGATEVKITSLAERFVGRKKWADVVKRAAGLRITGEINTHQRSNSAEELQAALEEDELYHYQPDLSAPISSIFTIEKTANEIRVHFKNGEFRKFKVTPAGCKRDHSSFNWLQSFKGHLLPSSSQTRNDKVFFYSNIVHSKVFKDYIVLFLADGKVAATKTNTNTTFTKMQLDWIIPPQLRQLVLEDPYNMALLPSSSQTIYSDSKVLVYMSKAPSDGTLPGDGGRLPQLTLLKWDAIKEAIDKSTTLDPVGSLPLQAGWVLENFICMQTQELYTLSRPEPQPVLQENSGIKGFRLPSTAPLFMLELHLRDLSNVANTYHSINTFWKASNKAVFKLSLDQPGLQKLKASDILFGTLTCSSNLDKNGVIMLSMYHLPSNSSILLMIKHINLPGAGVLRSLVLSGGLPQIYADMSLISAKKQPSIDWKFDQEWTLDDNPFFEKTKVDMDYETAVGSKNIPITHSLRPRPTEMISGAAAIHKDYLLCCTEGGRVYLLKASARTKTPKLAIVGNKRGVKINSRNFGEFNLQGMTTTAIDHNFGRPKAKVCIFSSQGFVTTAELG